MKKRLVVLGLLLAIMQAPAPMPGQAAESPAQGSDRGQSQGKSKQGTRAQALPLVNKPEHSQTADGHSGEVPSEEKESSVKLTSLPPVTIASQEKTFWDHVLDWGPWVANILLAIVGFLQLWLLLRTWQTIERQADIMDVHAKDAKDSGTQTFEILKESADTALISAKAATVTALAAEESAKAANAQIQMMKDKERARLFVMPINEGFAENLLQDLPIKRLFIRIEHFGLTDAFNVRGYFTAQLSDTIIHPNEAPEWQHMNLPSVIKANSVALTDEFVLFSAIREDVEAINTGRAYLVFFGFIFYDDIFGEEHKVSFDCYWKTGFGIMNGGGDGPGGWEKCETSYGQTVSADLRDVIPKAYSGKKLITEGTKRT